MFEEVKKYYNNKYLMIRIICINNEIFDNKLNEINKKKMI